jgi:hypothetical protein
MWILAVSVGAPLVGVAVGSWITDSVGVDRTAGDDPLFESRVVVQLVLLGLSLTVAIGGVLWGVGTGRYVTRWRAISAPLNFFQKRRLRRQLAGKEPVDYDHLDVVLAIAHQTRA